MTISNSVNNRQFVSVSVISFTANGSYNIPDNVSSIKVECIGAGGGGGGAATPGGSNQNGAGSGGGGAYAVSYINRDQISGSVTVTVGAAGTGGAAGNNAGSAGGTTSFGAFVSAGGGGGGDGAPAGATSGGGGSAGVATAGDLQISGGAGLTGARSTILSYVCTRGGANNQFGWGGQHFTLGSTATSLNGQGAFAFGGGGGGAAVYRTAGNAAGGNGAPGIVLITEHAGL